MNIIGLSAKAGCGKTTTAKMLLEHIPGALRLSFGDNIKREAATIYGFPIELAYSEAGKVSKVTLSPAGAVLMGRPFATVREILQFHGTDLRRAQDEDYWIGAMDRALAVAISDGVPCVVVDDCRFPGEFDLLHKCGAKQFRIEPYPGWTAGCNANHESETAVDNCSLWDMVFCPEKGQLHDVALSIYNVNCKHGDNNV